MPALPREKVWQVRKPIMLVVLLVAVLALSACTRTYPGFGSPAATLKTYFMSSQKADYSATWSCYSRQYQAAVPEGDFASHRKRAGALKGYHVESVSVNGDSAAALVSLTFAPIAGAAGSPPTVTKVRENLVRESGSWKIKVW